MLARRLYASRLYHTVQVSCVGIVCVSYPALRLDRKVSAFTSRPQMMGIVLTGLPLCAGFFLPYHINFHNLRSLTDFANIQATGINITISCGIDLCERELLRLASSWAHLKVYIIGGNEGCTASSIITPGGFV